MSFYSISPCMRCQRDVWKRGPVVETDADGYVEEYTCFYDGWSVYLKPQQRLEAE